MKPTLPLVASLAALAVFTTAPAMAQNAVQVGRAQGGASCPGCNLFQAELSNAELKGRNFSHSRLRQSNLSLSVMNGTNFSGADLRDVNAYAGVFTSSSFVGADLTHASFVGTYLEGANFAGAHLVGTNFSGAEMSRARGLSQAQLDSACGDSTTELPSGLRIRACR